MIRGVYVVLGWTHLPSRWPGELDHTALNLFAFFQSSDLYVSLVLSGFQKPFTIPRDQHNRFGLMEISALFPFRHQIWQSFLTSSL